MEPAHVAGADEGDFDHFQHVISPQRAQRTQRETPVTTERQEAPWFLLFP
jgi:hypothetical protein